MWIYFHNKGLNQNTQKFAIDDCRLTCTIPSSFVNNYLWATILNNYVSSVLNDGTC